MRMLVAHEEKLLAILTVEGPPLGLDYDTVTEDEVRGVLLRGLGDRIGEL